MKQYCTREICKTKEESGTGTGTGIELELGVLMAFFCVLPIFHIMALSRLPQHG